MYRRAVNTHLVKQGEKFFLTDTHLLFEVNEIGARIYDLCNGNNSVDDIAHKIAKKYDVDVNEVKSDVNEYIANLLYKKIIV